MKKILNIILCALVAISLFTLSVSADGVEAIPLGGTTEKADFNEDFSQMTFRGENYTVIDDSNLYYGFSDYSDYNDVIIEKTVDLTAEQKKKVSSLDLTFYSNGFIIDAEYILNTGVEMYITYMNDKYLDKYKKASNGKAEEVYVCFEYPDDNYFETHLTKLKENKTTKSIGFLEDEYFRVCIDIGAKAKGLGVVTGDIFIIDGVYYYLDYKDAGIKSIEDIENLDGKETYTVYEITDPDTVWNLENCYNLYNEDMGIINDEDAAEAVVNFLATIVFAVLPLVVLVLSVIFAIRFKEKYRKLFIGLGAVAIAEIIVFAIISVLLK